MKLIKLHAKLGNKWTRIAAEIGGRTDNAAKNRYSIIEKKFGMHVNGRMETSSFPETGISTVLSENVTN